MQERLGRERAGAAVEDAMAEIATGPGRARRAPAGRGGRRDLGRGGRRARRRRRCASARRSIPACRGPRSLGEPAAAAGAEVRQLRRARLLHQGVRARAMSEEQAARGRSPRCGALLTGRGLAHGSTGNISVRLDDGWLITPTNSSPRPARSGADLQARPRRPPSSAATRRPRRRSCIAASTRCGRRRRAIVHLHSTHSVAISCLAGHRRRRRAAAAHRLLRDARRQAAAGPLLPARRPAARRRRCARSRREHPAVLLANHGPVVAGRTSMPRSARSRSSRRPPSCSCCCTAIRSIPWTPPRYRNCANSIRSPSAPALRRVGTASLSRSHTAAPAQTCRIKFSGRRSASAQDLM